MKARSNRWRSLKTTILFRITISSYRSKRSVIHKIVVPEYCEAQKQHAKRPLPVCLQKKIRSEHFARCIFVFKIVIFVSCRYRRCRETHARILKGMLVVVVLAHIFYIIFIYFLISIFLSTRLRTNGSEFTKFLQENQKINLLSTERPKIR